jgi:predicted  nucleic acid-binding Zn-ribbon protein
VKATPEQQLSLLDVQERDTELLRLSRRDAQLPQRATLEGIAASVTETRDAFMDAQRQLEDTQLEMQRLDDDVATVKQRLHRDEAKLDESTSGKEASALSHELETLNQRAGQLEEIQFAVMEKLEDQQQTFDNHKATLDQLNQQRVSVQAELDRELEAIAASRAAIGEQRAAIVASLPSELVELYEQTRERYGIGAARLRGNISEGSNMALTDADLVELRNTDPNEVVFCQASGCILVRTKDSAL